MLQRKYAISEPLNTCKSLALSTLSLLQFGEIRAFGLIIEAREFLYTFSQKKLDPQMAVTL